VQLSSNQPLLPASSVFRIIIMTKQTVEQVSDSEEKKTPKSTLFIMCNVFFERYSTAGILGDCLRDKLSIDQSTKLTTCSNFGSFPPSKAQLRSQCVNRTLSHLRVSHLLLHNLRGNHCRELAGFVQDHYLDELCVRDRIVCGVTRWN
jgi:hypothetical protein